jgi:hypothetical protein
MRVRGAGVYVWVFMGVYGYVWVCGYCKALPKAVLFLRKGEKAKGRRENKIGKRACTYGYECGHRARDHLTI